MSRVIITGAGEGSPNRLEIHDFVKQEKQFSLYIQALQYMYSHDSQDNVLSFFQVGGIHGLPNIPWNGAVGSKPFDPNQQWGGYCTHGSVLFPTWHRPYVMLYEQILNQRAQQIAATYKVDQDSWKSAAIALRQPYWDWAANSVPPPEVISLDTVTITTPDGKKTSVPNPLLHYTFHPIDASFPSPYKSWQTTHRQPKSSSKNTTDNITQLQKILSNAQNDITTGTYAMLTRLHDWTSFSNHTTGNSTAANSVESIHDSIHVYVGGNGHMSNPAVAGFDPIFFLHHANVDRMLSLWSGLNPGVWVSQGDSEDGTFTLQPDVVVNEKTPLTPFWNAQTTFWASSTLHDTAALGYTYPEFNALDMGNTSAVQKAIAQKVNQLYGSSSLGLSPVSSLAAVQSASLSTAAESQLNASAAQSSQQNLAASVINQPAFVSLFAGGVPSVTHSKHTVSSIPPHSSTNDSNQIWDWTARIEFKKFELGCSFAVLLFLGNIPEDPEEWLVSPNFVGAQHAFVNSAVDRCANCQNQADIVIEGFVHLNNPIAQHSGLATFDPDVVKPYLTKELHWRVQKVDGTPADLHSLEVSVIATPMSFPPGAMFPIPGQPQRHGSITYGRSGGSRQA